MLLRCASCGADFQPALVRGVAWLEEEGTGRTILLREQQVTLGRGAQADVRIANLRLARLHLRFTRLEDGAWDVVDLNSPGGTFINHRRIRSASDEMTRGHRLTSGDVFNALDLRFHAAFVPQVDHFALLDEQAEDEAAWRVWADALLEKAHPLGLWLSAPPDDADARLAFIGALASASDPNVRVEWNRFGFARTLTLRDLALFERPWFGDPARAPGLQYLTQLTLEVNDPRVVDVLRAIPLPRSLRRIEGVALPSETLASLRERCPLLR